MTTVDDKEDLSGLTDMDARYLEIFGGEMDQETRAEYIAFHTSMNTPEQREIDRRAHEEHAAKHAADKAAYDKEVVRRQDLQSQVTDLWGQINAILDIAAAEGRVYEPHVIPRRSIKRLRLGPVVGASAVEADAYFWMYPD